MLKIVLSALLCLGGGVVAQQSRTFTIEGTISIESDPIEFVLVYIPSTNSRIPDTAVVKNGKYRYTGVAETPLRVNLAASVPGERGPRMFSAPLLVGQETISIHHENTFDNFRVQGSAVYEEFKALKDKEQEYVLPRDNSLSPEEVQRHVRRMQEEVYGQYFKKNPHSPLAIYVLRMYGGEYSIDGSKIAPYFEQLSEAHQQSAAGKQLKAEIDWGILLASTDREDLARYVAQHPESPIALGVLEQYSGYEMDVPKVSRLFSLLPDSVQQSPQGVRFASFIEASSGTGMGEAAPEFAQNDSLGRSIAVSSFRGNYLLIDFWASWCVPCRKENPNLVKAYSMYKDRGFEILGVALEQPDGYAKWIKAIQDDGLTWPQVSDFKFWQNEAAVLYGVRAVSQNFLIDPEGLIIGRNLFGEALLTKLNELLGIQKGEEDDDENSQ